MNNRGQSLVLFALLMPIFIMMFALIFDSSIIVAEHIKLKSIGKDAVENIMEKKESSTVVKDIILKNDDTIEIIEINNNSVHLKKNIDSYFGKIIGYDTYELEINYVGFYENGELRIKEKGNWDASKRKR